MIVSIDTAGEKRQLENRCSGLSKDFLIMLNSLSLYTVELIYQTDIEQNKGMGEKNVLDFYDL